MQSAETLKKILLLIALIFLYLIYSGGLAGLIFLFYFALTLCTMVFIEMKAGASTKEALAKVFGFFEKLGVPLAQCFVIVTLVIAAFFMLFGTPVENISKVPYMQRSVFLIILIAPIAEEVTFRGIMLGYGKKLLEKLKVSHAELFALVLSSLLFGLAHAYGTLRSIADIGLVLATFIVGLILGRQFLKEGLVSAIWLHGIYNLIVFLGNYVSYWVGI